MDVFFVGYSIVAAAIWGYMAGEGRIDGVDDVFMSLLCAIIWPVVVFAIIFDD